MGRFVVIVVVVVVHPLPPGGDTEVHGPRGVGGGHQLLQGRVPQVSWNVDCIKLISKRFSAPNQKPH